LDTPSYTRSICGHVSW